MNNEVLLTLAEIGGNTVSEQRLFNPSEMKNKRAAGTAVTFEALDPVTKEITNFKTGALTLAELQSAINSNAPTGRLFLLGVLDATDGKAVGSHDFLDVNGNALVLPDNSRVWDGYYEVLTTFTDGDDDSATIAFSIATDDVAGIKAATAISTGTTYDAGAPVAIIQVGTVAAISEKTTAARKVQADVAVHALTAGKLILALEVQVGL